MKLFNTLGRKLEEFKPIDKSSVKLYTCGPTVYDYPQLGNLRSFVFDDTLRRALEASGYKVRHVMNITDVGHLASDMDEGEDKLEKGAEREGKSVWEVAEQYTKVFEADMAQLNILPPNGYQGRGAPYARATDFIDQQIEIIKLLLDKGFAYQTEQAIYFDVSKLDDYGKLSGQQLGEKEVGARPDVVTDASKYHPQDFALWFFRVGRFANHSMHWPSPWGEGFPGWHLECSAIIHATLGEPVDIHTGGVDHIGTHHTNEMAQTEAAFARPLANYWLHNEFLLVDGQRMGKSLGNFFTLDDIKKRGYEPTALRLLFLQAHYRSQLNFTWESLDGAQALLKSLRAWADGAKQANAQPAMTAAESERLISEIKAALQADLNSARALAQVSQFVDKTYPTADLLRQMDEMLGLGLASQPDIGERERELVESREAARQKQDWAEADRIRAELEKQKIGVNDTEHGPVWYRL